MERSRSISWPNDIDESILKQKKISCTIVVQKEYQRTTQRREGAALISSIHKDTGCIVVAHWGQSAIKRFDVYAGTGSKNAVATINKWIARGDQKSRAPSVWAKTPAFNHGQWHQEQLELLEEEKMEFFLGPIPDFQEGEPVRPKVTVDWPKDLLSNEITPTTAFGNNLQALDDIRKRDRVFITLESNNVVEILGFDIIDVEAAESHYKTMVERVRIDKCSLQQATNMILDEREGIDIVLLRADSWWPTCPEVVVPRLLPSPMMDQPGSFREDRLHDAQLEGIRAPIELALASISYKKGFYDLVVRFGCVALDSKKMGVDQIGKKHHKEKFIKAINGKVDLVFKRWVFDNVLGTQLYRRLIAAGDFLEPTRSAAYWGKIPNSLEQTRPSLRGTWIFLDPNNSRRQPRPAARNVGRPALMQQAQPTATVSDPSSLILLQIEWTYDDDEGSYEKSEPRFYNLEPGRGSAKTNMDINLLELGQSRAWSFALESMVPISKLTVPPVLTGFARRVAIKPDYDVTSTQDFAKWDKSSSATTLIQHVRLDKIYSFGVQETCYKVELTAMWYPKQSLPCWGLSIRHTEWATHLAKLEQLKIGHRANWGDIVATFLPDDGGSSPVLQDDYSRVSEMKPGGIMEEPQRRPSREGVRILTNILLQLSEIVSLVAVT